MANPAPVLSPVHDMHSRGLSITLPAPAAGDLPELSPRSSVCAAPPPAEPANPRHSAYFSDSSRGSRGSRADLDAAPGDTTPRTSFSSGSCTPPKPLRRASGRRPLSVVSNSSVNSDSTPLPAGLDASASHGLGVSCHAPARPAARQTPEPYSPSKHRRHRSMISASIDYRTQYASPHQFGHPLYVNYTPRPQTDPSASPHPTQSHQYSPFSPSFATCAPHQGPFGAHNQIYGAGAYPSPGPSPLFDASPLSPPMSGSQSPGHSDPIQDLFVAMAYKERQVLEARRNLEEATEVLNTFKRQLKAMISPQQVPVRWPCRPTIISRRHYPNVGIHTLAYTQHSSRARGSCIQIAKWRIDEDVSDALNDEMCCGEDEPPRERGGSSVSGDGLALRIIKCMLGIVHCVIATLPVYQRDFARQPQAASGEAPGPFVWTAAYPLPMETLFGYLAHEGWPALER